MIPNEEALVAAVLSATLTLSLLWIAECTRTDRDTALLGSATTAAWCFPVILRLLT